MKISSRVNFTPCYTYVPIYRVSLVQGTFRHCRASTGVRYPMIVPSIDPPRRSNDGRDGERGRIRTHISRRQTLFGREGEGGLVSGWNFSRASFHRGDRGVVFVQRHGVAAACVGMVGIKPRVPRIPPVIASRGATPTIAFLPRVTAWQ